MPQFDPKCEDCRGTGEIHYEDFRGRSRVGTCSCYPLIGDILVIGDGWPFVDGVDPDGRPWVRMLLKEEWSRRSLDR